MLRGALQQEGVDVAAAVRPGSGHTVGRVLVDGASGRRAIVESRDPALDMALTRSLRHALQRPHRSGRWH
jgi:hypothetical protein